MSRSLSVPYRGLKRAAAASICFVVFSAASLWGAVLPEQLGTFKRASLTEPAVDDKALWDEYGLEVREEAVYRDKGQSYTLSVWRFKDPTGAYAGRQVLEAKTQDWKQVGNYIYRVTGDVPKESALRNSFVSFPNLDVSALPFLENYLPAEDRVAGSMRYVLGPASLERFEPSISPSLAAFSLGAEAQGAVYRIGGAETKLLLFTYPTPQIARKKAAEFQMREDLYTKRAGPLLAVLIRPTNPDAAERFLSKIRYESSVTIHEPKNKKPEGNVADMLISIGIITLVLIILSVLLGMAFGGFRMIRERFGLKTAEEGFTSLDLRNQ
jgi:hypothetical protein